MQVVRERQAAVAPTAGSKAAAAIALMALPAQPVLKEARSMSGPLKAPELPPLPNAKHAIGGGTAQVLHTASQHMKIIEFLPQVWQQLSVAVSACSAAV